MLCIAERIIMKDSNELKIIAFFFDSSMIDESFYGDVVFENIIKGREITLNSSKIIFSRGDVLDKEACDDINPFVIKNDLCTITKINKSFSDYLYVCMLEDIEQQIAIKIDSRLKETFSAYVGMTTIDIQSTDSRKQFWKMLIRDFSVEYKTITCFACEEEGTSFAISIAESYDYIINYDGFPNEWDCYEKNTLFSTRQSSLIKSLEQLEVIDGKSDSDRGIMEMNFALVKELGISGVEIWKAIEDINCVYIAKEGKFASTDYIFTSLYQASQGLERILKILIELIVYKESPADKEKTDRLLYSHKHMAMYEFISEHAALNLNTKCKEMLSMLESFYKCARYNRFSYSENDILELTLIQKFGRDLDENDFDNTIKHLYGKSLGKTAQSLYALLKKLCYELNIYVYEISSESVATYVFHDYYGNDLYETLKQLEQSKKELIWYLMRNEIPLTKITNKIPPLPFEECDMSYFIHGLITNNNDTHMIYDFVSNEYDELVEQNKQKWKERCEIINDIIGNTNLYFEDELCDDYEVDECDNED